jgi:tetratricopeptide (TPR) repeat protein
MVEIPVALVERLRTRQAVLITGLGCSELVGAPGWVALTEWLAARLVFSDARATVTRLVAAGRLADATALIRDLLPHPVLEEAMREAFPDGGSLPDGIRQVAGFPWRAVVATGFGDLWERALAAGAGNGAHGTHVADGSAGTNGADGTNGHGPQILVGTDDLGEARAAGAGTPLMHLFGRIAEPESLCLGPGDARARLAASGGLAWLDDLGRRRSFVFVGFRPSDPDLAWLSAWLSSRAAGEGRHFLFLDVSAEDDPDTEASLLALRTGLEVIPCLGGTAEALDRLARAVGEIAPSLAPSDADVDIDQWLARWEANPDDPAPHDVLARAEAALRADERWDRLIELQLRRLELEDDPDRQRAALREVARLFRDVLDVPERALTAGIAALRIEPDDDALWDDLRADAGAADAWERLCNDAADVALSAGATPGAARIWREIAAMLRHQLGRAEEALAAYRAALAAEPGHAEARDGEAELLRELERWEELVAALRAGANESLDPARAAALMLEAAEVLEGRLDDVGGAIAAYEAALLMTPDSESTTATLERLYERERRWSDLAALLDRRATRLPAPRAGELRRRRVEILTDHLDALDVAARELESLIDEEPTDRLLFERLEALYLRADRPDDYLRTLRRRADITLSPAERLAILRRLAAEGESRPGGLERAAEALERILDLEPRDADAFPALLRIYEGMGRHPALIAARARRLEVTETAEARRELLLAQAETYEHDLDDPEKALEAYGAVEAAGDRRVEIFEATARLAERLGRWDQAAEALAAWVDVTETAELQAELLVQAANIHRERRHDLARAAEMLAAAIEVAPGHTAALAALGRVRRDAGEPDKAAEAFVEAAAREEDPRAKADLYAEAAALVQEKLAQEPRAVDLYTRALAADPACAIASERLVDIYSARKQWAEVEALLDIQARQLAEASANGAAPAADADRQLAIEARLANACLELGKVDKALDCLEKAQALRPDTLPVLRPLAKIRFDRGAWKEAAALGTSILRLHREALSPEEALEVVMALGRCESELGNADEAIRRYQEARVLDARNRPALEALCALHADRKDWRDWVGAREELVPIAAKDERPRLWEEIGDTCAERLGDPARAEAAYRAALEAEPGRRGALGKLLDLYSKGDRWQEAADTLATLARIETEPGERAKTLLKAALVARDGLHAPAQATALLERCLDDDPRMTEAWTALEALHTNAADWKALAASIRRMLERLPADASNETRHGLWSRLGDVAYERLRDRKLATAAFEAATGLDPSDVPRQATLARLYEAAGPSAREQAIAAHQRLLARDPDRLDSYQALAKLYGDVGEIDKQWCVAAALVFLGRADPVSEAVFKRYRPPQVRPAKHSFSEEVWQRIRHPNEDALLDEMFTLTAPFISAASAQAPQSFGLRRRQRVDFATDTTTPPRMITQIAETMRLPRPDLYTIEGETGQTALLNVQEKGKLRPALLLGPATLRRASFDLVYELSSHLVFLRQERFLRFALATPAALEFGWQVTLRLAGSAVGPGGAPATSEAVRLTDQLRKTMPAALAGQLAEAGRKLMARGQAVDLAKWAAATDLSAARCALLLSGDLGAAARVITGEPIPTSPVPVRKRLADLVAFSASEDYFACRRHLGLHISPTP